MSTAAVVLPLMWAAMGLAAVAVLRPARRLPLGGARRGVARSPLVRLGACARAVASGPGRTEGDTPDAPGAAPVAPDAAEAGVTAEADRLVGGALVLAATLAVLRPSLLPVPLALAVAAPRLVARRASRRARERWADALPDAVDLLALGLGSGVAVVPALGLVAPAAPAPVGPALARAGERARHGVPLDEALAPLAGAAAEARSLAALLVAAHHDGAPVVDALSRLAADLRADRRRAVEARARQVPVRMLFPLVLCTLPAFVLLTVVPPVVAALSDLQR